MTPTFYISDCYDDNVRARYASRIQTCVKEVDTINFIGVVSDIEASGNLVDILDGLEGKDAIIFLNVAPRGTIKKQWPNGTPFGHLKFQNADIFTTIDGYSLSLLQKISGEQLQVEVYDIPLVVKSLSEDAILQERIVKSQFRSFDFLPRVAGAVLSGVDVPFNLWADVPKAPSAVWWVDNFGNAKTTVLNSEVNFTVGQEVSLKFEDKTVSLKYFDRLKDIPFGESAVYCGSSGLGEFRFLEITKQKGDHLATQHFSNVLGLETGNSISLS